MNNKEYTNIVFIGLMGSGKTSIGKKVARILGFQFIDTDEYVEKITGKKIAEIFKQEGELRFRSEETLALKRLSGQTQHVISTGGGIVVKEENRNLLKELGMIIYLEASVEKIFERVSGNKKRPLLRGTDVMQKIMELKNQREHLYKEMADLTINTGEKSFDSVVQEIIRSLKR